MGEYVSKTSKGEGGIYNSINLNLYHYGNNNPISYKDPDGEIVLNAAAALVDALSGAAIGAVTTAIAGGSGRDIAAAVLGGAASGALAGVTLGGSLVAQAAGAAALGAASGVIGDVVVMYHHQRWWLDVNRSKRLSQVFIYSSGNKPKSWSNFTSSAS